MGAYDVVLQTIQRPDPGVDRYSTCLAVERTEALHDLDIGQINVDFCKESEVIAQVPDLA